MIVFRILWLSGALIASTAIAQRSAYLPVFFVQTANRATGTFVPFSTFWTSSIQAYNAGNTSGYVRTLDRFLLTETTAPCVSELVPVPPHTSGYDLGICGRADGAFAFIKVEMSTGIVLGAHVGRVELSDCGRPPLTIGQGRSALPIFESLFPAGTTTLAGDVVIGSSFNCAAAKDQAYWRRVNLTVLNAGSAPADFFVRVLPTGSFVPFVELTYTVGPRQLQQFPLPLPEFALSPSPLGGDISVWIEVTSTQPYLSYVSSIFENGEPGSQPFELFPSRLP